MIGASASLLTLRQQNKTEVARLAEERRQADQRLAHERRQTWLGLAADCYATLGTTVRFFTALGAEVEGDEQADPMFETVDRLRFDLHRVAVLCQESALAHASEDVAVLLGQMESNWRTYRTLVGMRDRSLETGREVAPAVEVRMENLTKNLDSIQTTLLGARPPDDPRGRDGAIADLRDAIRSAQQ